MHKEHYDALRATHPELPAFDELDAAFEISTIEKETHVLREIRRKMNDKFENVIDIIERILQPDPHRFIDMLEYKSFTETEKQQLFNICKNFVYHQRLNIEAEITLTDNMDATAIRAFYDTWQAHKHQLVHHIAKLKESWKKDVQSKEIVEYFG